MGRPRKRLAPAPRPPRRSLRRAGANRPEPVRDLDWSSQRAREFGEATVGLWAELIERLPELPVSRDFQAAEVAAALELDVPDEPLPLERVMEHVRELVFEQSMY